MAKLKEIAEINPTEALKKNSLAKYVAMENLQPFTRKISKYEEKKYQGGMKFRNDDTLMARITPCLENGKTAYVDILEDEEVGFGSTEYIVIREKEGISDSKYLYYLAISPRFREVAIKAMSGTSGRQRVELDVLKNIEISLPPLSSQHRIANILSSFDNKIELLRKENNTLEDIAQSIFKEWFVKYNFPNKDGKPYRDNNGKMIDSELGLIPEGWRVGKLGEIADLIMGQSPNGDSYNTTGTGTPLINGAQELTENGIMEIKFTTSPTKLSKSEDILFCIRATIGNIHFADKEYCLGRGVAALRPLEGLKSYVYELLQTNLPKIEEKAEGSIFKQITKVMLYEHKISYDHNTAFLYSKSQEPVINKFLLNKKKINNLSKVKNILVNYLIE